jgi:hypothetical protein
MKIPLNFTYTPELNDNINGTVITKLLLSCSEGIDDGLIMQFSVDMKFQVLSIRN